MSKRRPARLPSSRPGDHLLSPHFWSRPFTRLLVAFLAWLAVLSAGVSYMFYMTSLIPRVVGPIIASLCAVVLRGLGIPAHLVGAQLWSSTFAIEIVDSCTGLLPMTIFAAGVLAYPASRRARLLGLTLGGLGIFTINLIRVVSLFYIGVNWRAAFDTAHYHVWQSAMLLVVLICLWVWVERLDAPAAA